jgi:transposase
MYSNIVAHKVNCKWVSRVPGTIKEASTLIAKPSSELKWDGELEGGYKFHMVKSKYKGVSQRWCLVYSAQGYKREVQTLERTIEKAEKECNRVLKQLATQVFGCEKDANKAFEKIKKGARYHTLAMTPAPIYCFAKKGRPKDGEEKTVQGYRASYTITRDEKRIEQYKNTKGRFILATNVHDKKELADDEILPTYKEQVGVERGFKFIKDNTFALDGIFLKTPHRIEAVMMLMTLCLMVYGLWSLSI